MRFTRSIAALVLMLFLSCTLSGVAAAQDEQPAGEVYPEGVTVLQEEIGIYVALSYEMTLQADSTVTIAVRSHANSLDPVLVLEGPDGEILAENNNHDSEYTLLDTYDALLESVPIPDTGRYTIHVRNRFWSIGLVDLIIIQDEVFPLTDVLQAVSTGAPLVQRAAPVPLRTTGPCTATGGVIPANLRDAPSLSGQNIRLLYDDEELGVDGYTQSEDGFTWYLIAGYLWAREDAVILQGDCSNLNQR